ncbi:type IV conjugative transfer system protein TraL [Methylobacterium sp.]|uniref:type IV conjugative transfer system protein TraL n=1 Tax=Methylobacterium sp. TaxID=409 RepID=UPI003C749447
MQENVITIEQRLQDQPRILIFPLDEGIALFAPAAVGVAMQAAIPGIVFAVIAYVGWKKLKGDGGVERILAAAYWFLPRAISPVKSWPDSAVAMWRG